MITSELNDLTLYKEYIEELNTDRSLVKSDVGFASYQISETESGKECYIQDIYIRKPYRKSKEASALADLITNIAKEKNCDYLSGTVIPSANNSTISLKVLLGYGFKLWFSEENIIWFKKDL